MVESSYNAQDKGVGTLSGSVSPAWAYPTRPTEEAIERYFTPEALAYVPTDADIFITNSKEQ